MKNIVYVGIISKEDYIKRTAQIAEGCYKKSEDEPKIWFESMLSMAQVLSNENRELLELIIHKKPKSIAELEVLSSRKKSNLSRTLKTLERYGIVTLEKEDNKIVPKAVATEFVVKLEVA